MTSFITVPVPMKPPGRPSRINVLKGAAGGYVRTRHAGNTTYIDWLKDYPNICTQEIRFGENLLDLTHQIKGEDVATVVIPLGARMSEVDENYQGTDTEERLTIAGVNDGRDCLEDEEAVALYGRIVKVVIHEDVTEESYLLSAGQRDLEESARLLSTITLNAIDPASSECGCGEDQAGGFHPGGVGASWPGCLYAGLGHEYQTGAATEFHDYSGAFPEDAEGRIRRRIIRYQRGYFLYLWCGETDGRKGERPGDKGGGVPLGDYENGGRDPDDGQ